MLIGKKDLQIDYWHNFYRTVFANLEEVLIVADVPEFDSKTAKNPLDRLE
ncbi:hypothetical protein [Zhenpiania hominis]